MGEFSKLLWKYDSMEAAFEGRARKVVKEVFVEWRDRYVAELCAYLRLYTQAQLLGVTLQKPYRNREWCNAAVSMLTVSPEEVQDRFLRAPEAAKDVMVQAVIDDDGLTDLNGHFRQLPPL